MSGFNVTLGDGTVVSIKAGEKIEDIKKKFGSEAGTIFEGLDSNTNGVLDDNELDGLKTKLKENNYEVELAEDGRTPKRAFNDAMQNMRNKYDHDNLKGFYKDDEGELWEVKKGDNLYTIAKKTLEAEGLPTDFRSINDRIAQIANLNNINDVNNIKLVDVTSAVELSEDQKQRVVEKLQAKLNKKIIANWLQDEDIIGGLIIKIDDNVINSSLKNRLEKLI